MKNILVVFGGRSAEHDVSIITAHMPIIDVLKTQPDVKVWPCYIAKDGSWYVDNRFMSLTFFQKVSYTDDLSRMHKVDLSLSDGLEVIWPGLRRKSQKIDIVFPAMHGTYGEDGSLMGLLRMANVPFVGCDLSASVVAMDKVLSKQVTGAQGIKSVPYVWFTRQQWAETQDDYLKQINGLRLPLFVKPVHLGSSIGITKVVSKDVLVNAIEVALHYDDKVIVEQGVQELTEVTVPVMGNDNPRAALVEESLAKADFFNFEDKYIGQGKKTNGGTGQYSNLPAKISRQLYDEAEALALASYKAIGAQGTARIDLLIDNKDGQIYLNEINTLPGSLYVHNWKQAGVSPVELVTELIELAQEAHKKRQSVEFTFDSSILKETHGSKFSG